MAKQGRKRNAAKVAAVTLDRWDMGATGPANRQGLVQEPATDMDPATGKPHPNPNGVKRMRRVDMLEVWHRKGQISTAGFNAGEKLRDAYEATERAPGWPDNDRVQSSSRPDVAVTMQVDRLSAFHSIARVIPYTDRAILMACVIDRGTPAKCGYKSGHYATGLRHLRDALDRLARALGS